jgi:hypothetical protein
MAHLDVAVELYVGGFDGVLVSMFDRAAEALAAAHSG